MLKVQFGRDRILDNYRDDKDFTLAITPAFVFFADGRILLSWLTLHVLLHQTEETTLFKVVPKKNLNFLVSLLPCLHMLFEIRRDVGASFIITLPSMILSVDALGVDLTVSWVTAGITLRFGSRTNPTDPSQADL